MSQQTNCSPEFLLPHISTLLPVLGGDGELPLPSRLALPLLRVNPLGAQNQKWSYCFWVTGRKVKGTMDPFQQEWSLHDLDL